VLIDGLTASNHPWQRASASGKEQRCRRYGHPASVLALDLDGLKDERSLSALGGDALIQRAQARSKPLAEK
jgi:hypothetical protein